jgi:glycine hydroxymethyltransferase
LGSPALTTRGLEKEEFLQIARMIDSVLRNYKDKRVLKSIKNEISYLIKRFPIPFN